MPAPNPIKDDLALIASVLAGDATAVNQLLVHAEKLARTHIKRNIPPSLHDDLVNGFLARLWDRNWRRLRAYRGDAPLAHYLSRIFTRCQIDFLRELAAEQRAAQAIADDPTAPLPNRDIDPGPEHAIGIGQLRDCLDKGLDRVTLKQQELLRLRHEESLRHREIAQRLERSMGTIASNLADAERALLRRMMGECAELLDDIVGVNRRGQH
jgi:RNA polymerase sigma factor (sigma-70 family)